MTRNLFFLFLLLNAGAILQSQEITFESIAGKTEVSVNERFAVQFVLTYGQENISVDHPLALPDFDGLHQLGESTINRFQLINGYAVNQAGLETILVADREGTYHIGSATITINGKKYTTEPITITVKKGLKPKSPAGQRMKEAFMTAELSDENPYVNQGVVLIIKMYSREYSLFQRLRNYKEPDFSDVIAKYVNERAENSEKQVLVNGHTYISKELARYILFPQRPGEIEIDPFSVNVYISSFLGAENIPLSTEPITMNAKNLPAQGRPSNFSGAVGEFTINTHISKTEARANEAINLDIEIIGTGNLNTLKTPKLKTPDDIETYPPKKREAIDLRPGGMKGKVVESYVLVPQFGGNFKINPISFNYFNPEKGKYVTLKSDPYNLKIDGPQPPKEEEETAQDDLVSEPNPPDSAKNFSIEIPKTINKVREKVSTRMNRNNYRLWGLGGILLLAVLFIWFRKKRKDKSQQKSEKKLFAEFKSNIDKQLAEMKSLANSQQKIEFLNLQEHLLTQIGIRYAQINLSDFTENAASEKMRPKYGELADQWKKLIDDCKQYKYGLGTDETDLNSAHKATEAIWKSFQKYKP